MGLHFSVAHKAALRLLSVTIFSFHNIEGRISKGIGMTKGRNGSLGNANDAEYFSILKISQDFLYKYVFIAVSYYS